MFEASGIASAVGARKAFFSEEKKQKTFASLSRPSPAAYTRRQKFFGCFFQKRTACLAFE
jgi:hypothetical protein